MVRLRLIIQLAVAGEDFVRMNIKLWRSRWEASELSVQITDDRKAAKDLLEKAKAFRATENLLGNDLIRRRKRAEEFGCVIAAVKRTEDDKSRGEEVGKEPGKSAGSEEVDAKKRVSERGEAQAGTDR